MSKTLLNKAIKAMMLGEAFKPDHKASLQALEEIIGQMNPRNSKDRARHQLALEQVGNLIRQFRKLEEENSDLKEQLNVIEEDATNKQNDSLNKGRK